eukprot:gene18625-20502_t
MPNCNGDAFIFASLFAIAVLFASNSHVYAVVGTITDITKAVGLLNVDGTVAAFCDFDSDRDTDVLVISNTYKRLDIYLWDAPKQKFYKSDKGLVFNDDTLIVGVAHSDFNGDGCPDILLITKNNTHQIHVDVYIYWSINSILSKNQKTYIGRMPDQPLIIDVNGDLLPDLFGIDGKTGQNAAWIIKDTSKRQYELTLYGNTSIPASFPLTNAFVDLTGDLHSDLFMPVTRNGRTVLQIWMTKGNLFKKQADLTEIQLPVELQKSKFGQISFGDLNADGRIDVILPVCFDANCILSAIYMYSGGVWSKLLDTDPGKPTWRFPVGDFIQKDPLNFPPVVRIGDFNMDGYPDAAVVFEGRAGRRIAYLLENVACSSRPETMCNGSRALSIKKEIRLNKDAILIGFFDIFENGILDFLVVTKLDSNAGYTIKAYRNDFNTDTSFLKITVLSGRCYKKCTCANIETPYGANQVGAVTVYKTTSPKGKAQVCAAVLLSNSAHFSLQLPYTLFGLGRSPNFVEHVQVGISQGSGKVDRTHSWPSLIPNSQVIVIPFPPDKPSEWMAKLLVTPSKLLLQTGGVLIGTCVFVAGLILALYIKEKKEDEKEKRQEAHKFHFDAL